MIPKNIPFVQGEPRTSSMFPKDIPFVQGELRTSSMIPKDIPFVQGELRTNFKKDSNGNSKRVYLLVVNTKIYKLPYS